MGRRISKKVVFFFPSFASTEATAPLGILAVATPLKGAGYEVKLVDSTISPDFKAEVMHEIKDAICLAVSLVTGPMIKETVEIARAIKAWDPLFPVILGGWHPSLLPKQTLECEFIDIVVKGQGEDALLEVVQHLESGSSMDLIPGIGFKRDGKLHFTTERPLKAIVDLPRKAYELADFDAYERSCGRRWAMYISSLACPFNCSYCTNAGVYGRKWNAIPPEQFVAETTDLAWRYNLDLIWIVDDNFLVDLDRARGIAEGLVKAGSQFTWSIQATTNLTARLSIEDLRLLQRAGLRQICQGVDSGSPKILKAMNKEFQDFDSIYESASRCIQAGIRPSFNIIFAFPGEGRPERLDTIRFMMDVCRKFPGAEFWTNIFTPYPGSPIMERAAEIGIDVPKSLEGWADFFPRYTVLPWLKGKDHQRLQVMRDYLRLAFDRQPISTDRRGPLTRTIQKTLSIPARWRLDRDIFALPAELWINNKLKEHTAAKPAVDAKRLSKVAGTAAAC